MTSRAAGRPILIAGPTASGKSALALELAKRIGGAIVNADAMQVYRDLRILTARPSIEDEARVPHYLYGHVDATENYSVGRWLADARAALARIVEEGRVPIIVGGTGLYFKALLEGLAAVPEIPSEVRQDVRERLKQKGPQAAHAALTLRDPEGALLLQPADRARIARALEVLEATGRPLRAWHGEAIPPVLVPDDTERLFLSPEPAELRDRIDRRFDIMLEAGALDEVVALDARGLDPLLPAMKAHGVPWLRRHIRGEIDLATAAAGGKVDTRRYTKRQRTWFRHQMEGWTLTPTGSAAEPLQKTGT